jgi:uncharacterized protein (DUF433 family)
MNDWMISNPEILGGKHVIRGLYLSGATFSLTARDL